MKTWRTFRAIKESGRRFYVEMPQLQKRGYHFFMFYPYCRVEIFSDGTLFLAEEGDRIYEVTKTTGI